MLIVWSVALAAPLRSGEVVPTVFGEMAVAVAVGLCSAPHVRVVEVAAVLRTYRTPLTNQDGSRGPADVYSDLQLGTVVDPASGRPYTKDRSKQPYGDDLVLTVSGGPYQGGWVSTSPSAPQPVVGGRYLVAYHDLGLRGDEQPWGSDANGEGGFAPSTPVVDATVTLDVTMPLPSSEAFDLELEQLCASLGLESPLPAVSGNR